ncbi:MAG: GTP 3',8-cyclase MoaA, partial [Comamonas sp.]
MSILVSHAPTATAGLLDSAGRPLRDLRLSVIDQCNFRCTYCMPREAFGPDYPFLRADQRLSFDQMLRLATAFAQLGVRKIRLTGGEPLLRRGIEALIERLAGLTTQGGAPMEIALTTNGVLLADKARALRDAGLSRVTVSLDALDDQTFRRMTDAGVPVARVLEGIAAASAAGLAPVKVNTVVERGVNEDQVLPLVRFFKGTGVALRFIEYMDVGGAEAWASGKVVTAQELRARVEQVYPLVEEGGRDGGTAINFRHADGGGSLGFIASVSQPFCGDCSRARVSSDGQLYTCLFAAQGLDLKPWLQEGGDETGLLQALRQ